MHKLKPLFLPLTLCDYIGRQIKLYTKNTQVVRVNA